MAGMAHPWVTAHGGRERRLARARCHRRAAAHTMRAAWAPAGERRLFRKWGTISMERSARVRARPMARAMNTQGEAASARAAAKPDDERRAWPVMRSLAGHRGDGPPRGAAAVSTWARCHVHIKQHTSRGGGSLVTTSHSPTPLNRHTHHHGAHRGRARGWTHRARDMSCRALKGIHWKSQ